MKYWETLSLFTLLEYLIPINPRQPTLLGKKTGYNIYTELNRAKMLPFSGSLGQHPATTNIT
jgi:hypothetical protein